MSTLSFPGMRILLVNDDGVQARGIQVLEQIARTLSDDVWVVAPETQQSAKSHSLTFFSPLRPREVREQVWAVDGTPTDCVHMAMRAILPPREGRMACDLVLSGINEGANLAQDILYSGTVAAATEGALFGVRAIALSQTLEDETGGVRTFSWETALAYGADVVKRLIDVPAPANLYNVNFPTCAPGDVRGIAATPQGLQPLASALEAKRHPRGFAYYWFHELWDDSTTDPLSDLALCQQNYITVTPLSPDRTHYGALASLKEALGHVG